MNSILALTSLAGIASVQGLEEPKHNSHLHTRSGEHTHDVQQHRPKVIDEDDAEEYVLHGVGKSAVAQLEEQGDGDLGSEEPAAGLLEEERLSPSPDQNWDQGKKLSPVDLEKLKEVLRTGSLLVTQDEMRDLFSPGYQQIAWNSWGIDAYDPEHKYNFQKKQTRVRETRKIVSNLLKAWASNDNLYLKELFLIMEKLEKRPENERPSSPEVMAPWNQPTKPIDKAGWKQIWQASAARTAAGQELVDDRRGLYVKGITYEGVWQKSLDRRYGVELDDEAKIIKVTENVDTKDIKRTWAGSANWYVRGAEKMVGQENGDDTFPIKNNQDWLDFFKTVRAGDTIKFYLQPFIHKGSDEETEAALTGLNWRTVKSWAWNRMFAFKVTYGYRGAFNWFTTEESEVYESWGKNMRVKQKTDSICWFFGVAWCTNKRYGSDSLEILDWTYLVAAKEKATNPYVEGWGTADHKRPMKYSKAYQEEAQKWLKDRLYDEFTYERLWLDENDNPY